MRLIFMGTPEFAVPTLRALLASEHEMAAVYTQPPRPAGRGQKLTPSPVARLAEAAGIAVHCPVSLKSMEAQNAFSAHQADLAVVVAYGLLLPKAILDACPRGCINVHPSALPRWRGAAPIQRTLMAGDTATEICIMQMDEGLDTGAVLLRAPFAIPRGTTSGELQKSLAEAAAPLVLQAIATNLPAIPQSPEGVTYAAKITKEEARIDWALGAEVLEHRILGLSPAPGAWFELGGERFKVLRGEAIAGTGAPGEVIAGPLVVTCGSGALAVTEIQRQGKAPMNAADWRAGFALGAHTTLT